MDPIAIIAEIIATGEITREQRENYREWINHGGFPARVELHPAKRDGCRHTARYYAHVSGAL